jgi:hypothetical protein
LAIASVICLKYGLYRQAALERIAIDWLEANAIPYKINGDRP